MNEILIMSDSHGLEDEIITIKQRHKLTDMIHCGDSELDVDNPVLAGMVKVKGNCDFGQGFINNQKIEIGDLNVFITHGHLFDVRASLLPLSYRASEEQAQVICFGHTHIAGAEKIDNQLFINPGSIRLPRNRREKTYAILSFSSLDNIRVEFYTPSGEKVKDLTYQTSLTV